jgi:threonylcarbamoyladenosine tRNA methylthiotransferase MtaB
VANGVRKQRHQKMLALAGESQQNFNRRFLGRTAMVLWEKKAGGIWSGLTGNYIRAYVRSGQELTNKLLPVKLVESYRDGVWGEA